jgi:hypothetical protein
MTQYLMVKNLFFKHDYKERWWGEVHIFTLALQVDRLGGLS